MSFLSRLFTGRSAPHVKKERVKNLPKIKKLSLSYTPAVTYAVGDIHGQLDLYLDLEKQIVKDSQNYDGPALLILVGDMIDRGAKSAQLISHLLKPAPDGITRVSLRGNHEDMFLQFLSHPMTSLDWVHWGGKETLASYGIQADANGRHEFSETQWRQKLAANVPREHRDFLKETAACVSLPNLFFSHAGIDPSKPLDEQTKEDLLWGKPERLKGKSFPKRLVHGHVPVDKAKITEHTINIDTGACFSGLLSAVRLIEGEQAHIISVGEKARVGDDGANSHEE